MPWKLQQLGSSCLSSSAISVMGQQLPGRGDVGTRREVHGAGCARFTGMSCKEEERDVGSQAQHQPQSKQEIPRHRCRLET